MAVHAEQVSEYAQQKATDLIEIRKQVFFLEFLVFVGARAVLTLPHSAFVAAG